jgi:hypothetical protein
LRLVKLVRDESNDDGNDKDDGEASYYQHNEQNIRELRYSRALLDDGVLRVIFFHGGYGVSTLYELENEPKKERVLVGLACL